MATAKGVGAVVPAGVVLAGADLEAAVRAAEDSVVEAGAAAVASAVEVVVAAARAVVVA